MDVCTDMRADMWMDVCTDMRADMCMDVCTDMCADMCVAMFTGMRMDMCTQGSKDARLRGCSVCHQSTEGVAAQFALIAQGGRGAKEGAAMTSIEPSIERSIEASNRTFNRPLSRRTRGQGRRTMAGACGVESSSLVPPGGPEVCKDRPRPPLVGVCKDTKIQGIQGYTITRTQATRVQGRTKGRKDTRIQGCDDRRI